MLILRGALAHSHFRIERLLTQINYQVPQVNTLSAEFVHFIDHDEELTKLENQTLSDLLHYGSFPAVEETKEIVQQKMILVVPKTGTCSPWSYKATDIAHHCGLNKIRCIERGIAYFLQVNEKLTWGDSQAIADLLHDCMTEQVVYRFEDVLLSPLQRDPKDSERFLEKRQTRDQQSVFNARWIIDGIFKSESLLSMIKNPFRLNTRGVQRAFRDNGTILETGIAEYFASDPNDNRYRYYKKPINMVIKVETLNHAIALSPYMGTATGIGREIRKEVGTETGSRPKAGFTGFSVSNLHIPGFLQPWENSEISGTNKKTIQREQKSTKIASALKIILEAPISASQFNNEFGRAILCGYFRTFEDTVPTQSGQEIWGYQKPIMITGGFGTGISNPKKIPKASKNIIAVLGALQTEVQIANPELLRRTQEVINACIVLGTSNPIRSIRCSRAEEGYVIVLESQNLEAFRAIAKREACPFTIIEASSPDLELPISDADTAARMARQRPERLENVHLVHSLLPLTLNNIFLTDAVFRLLRLPCIADKSFLITISDRMVTGLVVRDPFVGPWQVPVGDCAVTAQSFETVRGEAMSLGERAPLALINPVASVRMAVGEAITNIAAANIGTLSDVRLVTTWISDVGFKDEGARLYDAVAALGLELCPLLGISIVDNTESLSLKTARQKNREENEVIPPLSLIVSAFAPVMDVRFSLTPVLSKTDGDTLLLFIDLSPGYQRMGGSALSTVYEQIGGETPDLSDPLLLKAFFLCLQQLNIERRILAYHDRSDGGLFVTLCEMAFASHIGLQIDISELGKDPNSILFNEELGVVVQVRSEEMETIRGELEEAGVSNCYVIGALDEKDTVSIVFNEQIIFFQDRIVLQQAWSETSYHMQAIRDNPRCAKKQYEMISDRVDPGMNAHLMFDLEEDITSPYINLNVRPRIAILREQGTNGHLEMAAAFDKALFECIDVHVNDLQEGSKKLNHFKGLAISAGFSYGDVLGAGMGFAKRILFNPKLCDQFQEFFNRSDTFTLGISNGAQVLSGLKSLIPGAGLWPKFVQNYSEQFESRWCLVEVQPSTSIVLRGMEGSRLLIPASHKEGRVVFENDDIQDHALTQKLVTLRYVDSRGRKTRTYPANPNGSPLGVTGLTTTDGRVTIMMPQPERAFRTVQYSWHPKEWGENGPWLRLFRNARVWVG